MSEMEFPTSLSEDSKTDLFDRTKKVSCLRALELTQAWEIDLRRHKQNLVPTRTQEKGAMTSIRDWTQTCP